MNGRDVTDLLAWLHDPLNVAHDNDFPSSARRGGLGIQQAIVILATATIIWALLLYWALWLIEL
jgi:hypothetical protein